jgi:hypothetical protein
MAYPEHLSLKDAVRLYFDENGFGPDGGYSSNWVDFKLGPIPCPIPNTDARKRAVPFHDLHHLVTGYRTDLIGEFEISAWEIASGCRDYVAAWQLNLGGLFAGLLASPVRIFRAFVRGRRMRNFYGRDYEALLGVSLAAARAETNAAADGSGATASDVGWFVLACLAGGVVGTLEVVIGLPIALVAAPVLAILARREQATDVVQPVHGQPPKAAL